MRNGNWDGLKGSTINIGLRHGQQHVSIYQRPKCRLITEIYPVLSHFTDIPCDHHFTHGGSSLEGTYVNLIRQSIR
jgi:hypothetical protein